MEKKFDGRVTVSFNEEQLDFINKMAEFWDPSRSEYIRKQVLGDMKLMNSRLGGWLLRRAMKWKGKSRS